MQIHRLNNNVKSIIGAKTVRDIDGYAESEKIEKFDLVINWGIFTGWLNQCFLY